ncbi:hypothetical protein AB4Z54_38460 [Streptomyces sp. MCAF7]
MRKLTRRSTVLLTLISLALGTTASVAGAEPDKKPVPKVAVIGTGGTISGVSKTRVSFQDYEPAGRRPATAPS